MKIQVLGPGCMKCNKLYDETEKAVKECGVNAAISKVEKIEEIMKFGVAFTPALVINGKVVSSGKVPNRAQIIEWINTT